MFRKFVGVFVFDAHILLFPPAINVREYRTRNVMPHGEYGAGNGRHGKARERSRRKACGESGILHADFDGESLCLGCREFQQFPEAESAAVAEQVVENYDGEHDGARRENLRCIVRDDCGYNHRDGNHRDERQDLHGTRCPLAEKLVDDEPERNRHDDDLHDGKEHRHHIHVHGGAQEQVRNRRSQHGSEQRVHACHAYRKRHVAFREVGDDVAGSPAGAGAYENNSRHQRSIKPENLGESKRERRHNDKLRRTPDGYFLGARKHELEIA